MILKNKKKVVTKFASPKLRFARQNTGHSRRANAEHYRKSGETPKLSFLNENIPFSRVLLVIDKEEKEIVTLQEALKRAKKLCLDLFCVAPDKNPPVCKLLDYRKYIFELSKKKKDKKENICKEVRISFNIGEKDLKDKLEKVDKWTEKG